MSTSSELRFEIPQHVSWLHHYSLADESLSDDGIKKKSNAQHHFQLPAGQLKVLRINAAPGSSDTKTAIEAARLAAIKFALRWKKKLVKQQADEQQACAYILILQIKNPVDNEALAHNPSSVQHNDKNPLPLSFGAQYAIEHLAEDAKKTDSVLQVFSERDWQKILATLLTPNDLWRLLDYHKVALQQSFASGHATFDTEHALVAQFMSSAKLYTQAISVDNALIKYALQDEPNRTLVAMSLAQRDNQAKSQDYQQQLQQAAVLWSELSAQMRSESQSVAQSALWQRQLLDESLFSRHQLITTLYQHANHDTKQRQTGYVIHQHSYECLGRHYVFIFYGQRPDNQSRTAIAPNLATIAKDTATRLTMAELHHIIVLGIEFTHDAAETFIDIDLFIQPVTAMSTKERQLTRQLQRLSQQQGDRLKAHHKADKPSANRQDSELPKLQLSLTIPANNNKP